jgi:pimeloyl-ACP methyl ester carboxylesterase
LSGTDDIYERLEASCERINLPVAEDANTHTVWRCWGDGPPVVLLHGDWGSWTHFIRNIDVLAARYRVLVPDMPGYGDSGFPPLDDVVADSAVIMTSDIDKLIGKNVGYDIVGFSYGGIHAGHMAALHSGRVGKVVLIGAGGMGIDAPVLYKRPMQRLSRDMDWSTRKAVHRNNLGGVMFHDEMVVDELSLRLQDANTSRTRIRAKGVPESNILLRALPDCTARFYGIWGVEDVYSLGDVPAREAILRNYLPDIDFRVLEDVGHWVLYEAPDQVNDMLLEMLD